MPYFPAFDGLRLMLNVREAVASFTWSCSAAFASNHKIKHNKHR